MTTAGARYPKRSVSQITGHGDCGMRYRLERVDRVPRRPGWSNIGGTVCHEIINAYERGRARVGEHDSIDEWMTPDQAAAAFAAGLRIKIEETRETTEFAPELWYAADGGREGREWWEDHGPQFVATYIEAQAERTATTAELGGVLMLEANLTAVVNGVEVNGIIDHVLSHGNGSLTIRDFKFGRSAPPRGGLQLPTYAVLLHRSGLLPPDVDVWADYWLGRKGTATRAERIDLDEATARVGYEAAVMDLSERAGLYPVKPSNLCVACSVRRACPVMGDDGERRPWILPELPNSGLLTLGPDRSSVLLVQERQPQN